MINSAPFEVLTVTGQGYNLDKLIFPLFPPSKNDITITLPDSGLYETTNISRSAVRSISHTTIILCPCSGYMEVYIVAL